MSQPSSNKGKDASSKKFASLNVNQTFKGTKVENRSAAGQTRHGLQSLGKVSQSRRVPLPANLPSLKKENLGNDPSVSLVPSGSSGWGKKEKSAAKSEDQTQTQVTQQKSERTDPAPEISLRPNAGAGFKNQSEQGKGWGNLQGGGGGGTAQPPSSNTFQREFPKLGVVGGGQSMEGSAKEQDSDEKEPASINTSNVPPRFAGDKWMPGQMPMQGPGQRPGGPQMNMPLDQQRPMFNGAPMQPTSGSQFYPYGPVPPYHIMMHPFPYGFPPGRMPPPAVIGQPPRPPPSGKTSEASDRPATVKTEDIQGMDDDSDDEGWAGAQEDVDYNVKLKFDESDEESDTQQFQGSSKGTRVNDRNDKSNFKEDSAATSKSVAKESTDGKPKDGPMEAWGDQGPGYQGQMSFRHPQPWGMARGPYPQNYPYPPPWMYPQMQGFRMPQMPQPRPDGVSQAPGQPATNGLPVSGPSVQVHFTGAPISTVQSDAGDLERSKPSNMERRKRQEDDERKESERREAAKAKLQALEEKIKRREEKDKVRCDSESSNKSATRDRLDSENSDSSRGAIQRGKSSRDTPPRFLKQQTQSKGGRKEEGSYSPASSPFDSTAPFADAIPVPRIMKRHDSLRSDDASSVQSHDSWANVSAGEQDKGRDTEESVFVSDAAKRMEKTDETEPTPKRNENYERRERRSDKRSGDVGEGKKVEQGKGDSTKSAPESSHEREGGSKQSSNQSLSSKTQRGEDEYKGRDSRKSSRSFDSRRDGNREYRNRDYREEKHGKRDDSDWKDRSKDEKQSRNRDRDSFRDTDRSTAKKERDTASGRKEDGFKESVSSQSKEGRTGAGSKEAAEKVDRERSALETIKGTDKDDKRQADSFKTKDSSFRSRPPPENFKRLEKSRGRGLAMKSSSSKADDKEKRVFKTDQRNYSDGKKPSAWSQVVSGEKSTDQATGASSTGKIETQPKKSLIEIQKEEEIKENEKENRQQSVNDNRKLGEIGDDQERDEEQDYRRQPQPAREKRYDDRRNEDWYGRRGPERYDERYDRRDYQGRRRFERDSRRTEDRYDRRRTEAEDSVGNEGKQDQGIADRGMDARKRGNEDRKRRHDETEAIDPYEKIYSEEVQAEGRMRERKVENQRSFERKNERGRFAERGRGIKGSRQLHSRGRGRGFNTARTTGPARDRFSFPEMKSANSGSFSEGLADTKETSKVDSVEHRKTDDFEAGTDNEHKEVADNDEDKTDTRKGRDTKELDQKSSGAPSRKGDDAPFHLKKTREKQGAWDYRDKSGSSRRDKGENRRGRGYSSTGATRYGQRSESRYESKYESRRPLKSQPIKDQFEGTESERGAEKLKSEKITGKGGDSDYEDIDDDDYGDDEEYTEDDEIEGDADRDGKAGAKDSEDKKRDQRESKSSEQGIKRGQSSRGQKTRYPRDYKAHQSAVPPRFQRQRSDTQEQRRGRSYGVRGTRSRGRASFPYRPSRGRGYGKIPFSKDSKSKSSHGESKDDDYSGDSDDVYHSAEGSFLGSGNEDSKAESKHARENDNSRRYSSRGKGSSRGSSTRGRGARRGGSTGHFLADRQQERVGHINASGLTGTLPAAGNASFAGTKTAEEKFTSRSLAKRDSMAKRQPGDQRTRVHAHSESQQEFAEPPKKMAKSKSIEKPDILRQFDVNNIASVVCIDDMPQNIENGETLSQTEENDGFVQVFSRFSRKVLRERQKEEEKKKLQEEMNAKSVKKNAGDTRESTNKPNRPLKFVEQHSQRVTQSFTQVTSQSPITSVSQSQTSNAAMAAVGGWEPAQALLRGVQMVTPTETLDSGKTPQVTAQPPLNAWKRPLNFAASLANSNGSPGIVDKSSAPDPKAVGTGKPNSSPAKQVPIAAQTSQPNEAMIVNEAQADYNEAASGNGHAKSNETGIEDSNMDTVAVEKSERQTDSDGKDGNRKQAANRKTEQRKINKGTKRETAPRFQSMSKSKVASNAVAVNGDIDRKQKMSITTEDVAVMGFSKLKGEDRAPGKMPEGTKLRRCNSESSKEQPDNGLNGFEGPEQPTLSFMRADIRTNQEKTSGNITEEIQHGDKILESLDTTLGKVDGGSHSTEEENAKDTARSVLKSLGDDDEKNLETRSLPSSTPPLVVEISPPGPKGPSSDPGKGPVMSVPNSMSQEFNEMSMKVLSAKVLWDMHAEVISESNASRTAWSGKDQTVATSSVVTTSAVVENDKIESAKVKDHVAPTPVAVVTAQGVNNKNVDDLTSEGSNDTGVISKKTAAEQQNNVCKVKPQQKQQQQHADGKQVLPSFSHSQPFSSQFALQQPYTLPVQTTTSPSKLQHQPYMLSLERADGGGVYSRERTVGDLTSQHAQPHAPINLQQVRPASPLSHQQQDVLQPSMMLGNIYSTPALQGSQQNTLLWPISRHSMQPATSLSYMSHPQSHEPAQDLLSSSATFSSTPLYMTYDQSNSSMFSAQRMNSQLQQNPPVGLVLQQPQLRTASLLNVMQANQSSKGNSVFSMSSSPNPFQQNSDLQLMGMSQSDLTKHVHAKPFQPSSGTPPGGQSSQMVGEHHSHFLGPQHVKFANQMNKLIGQPLALHQHVQQQAPDQHSSSLHLAEKRQLLQQHGSQHHPVQQQQSHLMQSHQQPIQPQSSSQHSTMPHQIRPLALQQSSLQPSSQFLHQHAFASGRIASVGPRSIQGKTVTTPSSVQAQTRLGSMSPVDQNMHFIHAGLPSVKSITQPQHSSLMSNSPTSNLVQVLPHSQNLPLNQAQNLPFTVRPSVQMQKYQRVAPGPIQRPMKPTGQPVAVPAPSRPKQSVTPIVNSSDLTPAGKGVVLPGQGSSFRYEEHQKMIEETKKYFAAQKNKNDSPVSVMPATHVETVSSSVKTPSVSQVVAKAADSRLGKAVEGKPGKPVEAKPIKPLESRVSKPATKPVENKPSKKIESKAAPKSTEVKETKPMESKDEGKSLEGKKDLPDIAASAMLNDPSDLFSIVKSRPSLAKAFKFPEGQEKSSDKPPLKKSLSKEEKPKRNEAHPSRGAASKGGQKSNPSKSEQKTGVGRPLNVKRGERSDRGRSSDKSRNSSNRGTMSNRGKTMT